MHQGPFTPESITEDGPPLPLRQAHWDIRARTYESDVRAAPVRSDALAILLSLFPNTANRILDAGTGIGTTALAICQTVGAKAKVFGTDISSEMLGRARRQSGDERIRWVSAQHSQLPFRSRCFDVVTSTFTLHHLPYNEKLQALSEFRRVLRPGGTLLLADEMLPHANITPDQMRDETINAFYSHLPKEEASRRLATYGEWPLTIVQMMALLRQQNLIAACIPHHPLVTVFRAYRVNSRDSDLQPHNG